MGDAASDAASLAQNNLPDLIPPEIKGDAQTAMAYYNAAASATSGVTVGKDSHGWPNVQLSPGAYAAVTDTIVAVWGAAFPIGGALYALLMALAPHAGAGPGTCVTDPVHVANPSAPTAAELRAWPHFSGWTDQYSPYPIAAAGTFEAYANPILEWNWTLATNCFSQIAVPSPVLLAALIHSWNQAHDSSSSRVVTRCGLVATGIPAPGGGWLKDPPSYDPIAEALDGSVQLAHQTPGCTGFDCYNGQNNVCSSFTINTGPLKVKPLTLHFGPSSGVGAKAPAPAAAASSVSGTTVAVVALGGAAALFVAKSGGLAPALRALRRML
jgi:hypothetical protein